MAPHALYKNGQIPTILHIGTKTNKNLERTIEALFGYKMQVSDSWSAHSTTKDNADR